MPVLLGLDLATRSGWAVGPPGERPIFGAEELDGGDPEGKIFSDCAVWIERLCQQHSVTHVFTEAPYVPRAKAKGPPVDMNVINRLVGMRALARMVAWENRAFFYREFMPSEIARHFTGFARFDGGRDAKKATTIAMAKMQGYVVGRDHDKADAIAIWTLGEATTFPREAAKRGIGPLFLGAK